MTSTRRAPLLPTLAAIALACAGIPVAASQATTYHLSPAGNDSNSGLPGFPWKTFAKAWTLLLPGERLIVADGSYEAASPPAGMSAVSGRPIVVQASNPGGAQLDRLVFKGNSHLAFIGFRIAGQGNAVAIVSNGKGKPSHHLSFSGIGFSCVEGTLNDDACFALADGTNNVLLEDSWGWGGGRYTVMCYGGPGGNPPNLTCDKNTFRRVVLRMGPTKSSGGNPQASLALYYAANNIVENVIAVDGKASSNSSNSAFYMTGHAPPPNSDFNRYYGVIALNNLGTGFYVDCPGAVCNGPQMRNSVFWGSWGGVAIAGGSGVSSCSGAIIDHNTIGAGGGANGFENYACSGATFSNNALYANGGFGARQSPSGGSTASNNNGYYDNAKGARSNLSSGRGDVSSDPRFSHIVRIEATSPYRNAGAPGDIGANVLNRYQDGTLTATPLWPWPDEDRLRAEMCAQPAAGFCSSGKSLTRYIWEYLGKPIPPGIYR